MNRKRRIAYYLTILVLGGLIGSALGEGLALVLPEGVVKQFFLKAGHLSLGPGTLDLSILQITFGFAINFNVIGVIGVFLVAYFLRWIE